MRLEGKLFAKGRLIRHAVVPVPDDASFTLSRRLDLALLALTKTLKLPLPIWLKNNTKQFARFHMTIFFPDQFMEPFDYDQYQIRLIEDEDERSNT
jgi:hypothetical protein